MWTLWILLNLWALYCTVSCSPPSPTNVVFDSVNLRNVLQWSPGNGTPNDTVFTVQYAIYGESVKGSRGKRVNWRTVRHCTEIVRCWCDLSNETWDLGDGYHAKVQAVNGRSSSKWSLTRRRFDPKSDTTFGPPLVSVDLEGNNAIIHLKGPMRYQPINGAQAVSMEMIYGQMTYNLSVHNVNRDLMTHFPVSSSPYKYHLMDYDTEYCFSAKTRFISIPTPCQPSEWHCRTTPPDPWITQMWRMVVGIVVPSVLMCMLLVICYLLYQYLSGKGQKSPYILNPPSFHSPPVTFPRESLNTVLIKVGPPPESRIPQPQYVKKQQQTLHPRLMYEPHRRDTPGHPEDPLENSSIDYGFVGQAPAHTIGRVVPAVYSPQAQSFLSQKLVRTETHMICTQTEVSELLQENPCLFSPASETQTQAPFLSFEDREKRGREFVYKSTQSSFLGCSLNIPGKSQKKVEVGEDILTGGTVGQIEEGKRGEREPLLSAYASQNIINRPTSLYDGSDYLPDDYGVLRGDEENEVEEDEELEEQEEKDEETNCVDWDPTTGRLVLPVLAMVIDKESGLMQGEKRKENEAGREEEKMEGKPRLENVYVRQGSEEKAEVLREMERGGALEWEADDLLTKWNLVISMDQ